MVISGDIGIKILDIVKDVLNQKAMLIILRFLVKIEGIIKMKDDKSTPIAKQYHIDQGYEIGPSGLGYDYIITKDGVTKTVEAKSTFHTLLPQQIKRLQEGGLLAIVDKKGSVKILTINDIIIGDSCLYFFKIKKVK